MNNNINKKNDYNYEMSTNDLNKIDNRNNKNTNLNIYNIVKNDKIIQNNYYESINKKKAITNSNINLKIENQNNISYYINNKKEEKDKFNSEKKNVNNEFTRNKFKLNQLQKCSVTDLFLPHKIKNDLNYEINNKFNDKINNKKNNNNEDKNKEEKNKIKDNFQNDKSKIIQNNNNNIIINKKCKDDFYYDLYAEKIINAEKVNNSYDELHLLVNIKNKYYNKYEKIISIDKYKKENKKNKKKVRFYEGDNRIIKMNQKDIASKFEILNNSGKKIYFKKCNINNYLNKLRNKNIKLKSILINKKEENNDDSEWDKLYDLINQIAKRNDSQKKENKINENKIKKGKFNIKNIESFKKKEIKIF